MTKTNLWMGVIVALVIVLLAGYFFSGKSLNSVSKTFTTTISGERFDPTAAEEEGYWYSRYNLGSLVMKSGLGIIFMPDKKVMGQAMKMVDADFDMTKKDTNYGDKNHPVAPKNPALLSAVYKSGDPHFTTKLDVSDFMTQRWDPASFNKSLTGLSTGFTMIKEIEWSKQFHVDEHFGTPTDNFGAQWRFVGMVMNMSAKMQAKYFLENKSKFDLSGGGDYVMLWALSDLGKTLKTDKLENSNSNRYKDGGAGKMFSSAADMMFAQVKDKNPSSIKEQSLAIQSLVWYAVGTDNLVNKSAALKKISLVANELKTANMSTASDKAYAIRGLIEAERVSGAKNNSLPDLIDGFLSDFNDSKGIFKNQKAYSIDDVGEIVGALNSIRIFEEDRADTDRAEKVFAGFFENVINKSGLQQSAPPIKVAKDLFEIEGTPKIYFRYPEVPMPPMAGGEFGIAPVFATSVIYENGKWSVSNGNFDSAGAMHASNEMIWLHHDEINGFPEVN